MMGARIDGAFEPCGVVCPYESSSLIRGEVTRELLDKDVYFIRHIAKGVNGVAFVLREDLRS